jgi:prepilin-type processing-associated H-X9-DG protein
VELLVVIAIIGTLVGLLIPAVQAARESARRIACKSKLKQIGLAMHTYHDAKNMLPAGFTTVYGSWFSLVMPYIEEARAGSLYQNWGDMHSGGYNNTQNRQFCVTMFPAFTCPSDVASTWAFGGILYAKHNYVVNMGNTAIHPSGVVAGPGETGGAQMVQSLNGATFAGAPFVMVDRKRAPVTIDGPTGIDAGVAFRRVGDGLSKTLMVSEVIQGKNPSNSYDLRGFVVWGNTAGFSANSAPNSTTPDYMAEGCINNFGNNPPCQGASTSNPNRLSARSLHQGGVNAVMCDGAVKFFLNDILVDTWRALSTTNGGETVDVP